MRMQRWWHPHLPLSFAIKVEKCGLGAPKSTLMAKARVGAERQAPKLCAQRRRGGFDVGIEVRQGCDRRRHFDDHAGGRDLRRDLQELRVRRRVLQAARDGEDAHGHRQR
jgi:hypothetical protein